MLNYYEVLGVNEDATPEQIKTAYRRLAKKYHPDVNDAPNAAAFFRLINEAYETLIDKSKRSEYDRNRLAPQDTSEEHNGYTEDTYEYEEYNHNPYVIIDDNPSSHVNNIRDNIPVADSILAIIVATFVLNTALKIHLAISILLALVFSVVLAAVFRTRIGWWIISIIYSGIWAFLCGGFALSVTNGDYVWFWTVFGVAFVISFSIHRHEN